MTISGERTEQHVDVVIGFRQLAKIWHSPSTSKQNIENRTRLSDGRRKEIYQYIGFFHGAVQLFDYYRVTKVELHSCVFCDEIAKCQQG